MSNGIELFERIRHVLDKDGGALSMEIEADRAELAAKLASEFDGGPEIELGTCDPCGRTFPAEQLTSCMAYGLDATACDRCREHGRP